MPSSTIRRQMKNVVNNYTDAEKKVREATSNDPWGPSSSLMSEIADLTYNVVAFSEIMTMIWRRLNDHGKNWRHVYKALTLLDYLVKTGSERVGLQCRENIFAIQTLKDFQYVDRDGKDQGINVREKSKQLVVLLKDDERLKGERSQALKTKERMAQVATSVGSGPSGFGRGSSQPNLSTSYSEEYGRSEGSPASYHGSTSPNASSELEQARPQTSGEEELQLQLALAMSREAAEQEERMRRGDDLRLQMALEESRKDSTTTKVVKKPPKSSLMDLMDIVPAASAPVPVSDPWAGPSATAAVPVDPWQPYAAASKPAIPADPWVLSSSPPSTTPPRSIDPWVGPGAPVAAAATAASDPWAPVPASRPKASSGTFDPFHTLNGTSKEDLSDFDSLRSSSSMTGESRSPTHASRPMASVSPDLFDPLPAATAASRKTPESFLGPNAALVNLDSLISKPPQLASVSNPFLAVGSAPPPPVQVNPFQMNQPQPPTLNQMRVNPMMGPGAPAFGGLPQMTSDPLSLASMPPGGPVAVVPVTGMAAMAPMGRVLPVGAVGVQPSMAVPQPLLSTGLPPSGGAQAGTTTNPFLL
ncbi:epsin-2 [Brienomyrus brachyistius]|uniref:epsin-2 n=1 Tax=Brienomyrus brachyistius TaxID=42636 RepID=UPI0020B3AEF4|nr:epsin-2 [Brienomyrus brachyistius]